MQEALWQAARSWPAQGLPRNPRGWLVTVAGRRLADEARSDAARRRRERRVHAAAPVDPTTTPGPDELDWSALDGVAGVGGGSGGAGGGASGTGRAREDAGAAGRRAGAGRTEEAAGASEVTPVGGRQAGAGWVDGVAGASGVVGAAGREAGRGRADSADRAVRASGAGVTGVGRADGVVGSAGVAGADPSDDTLLVLALCAHPALSPSSQMALTLRSVGGLSTAAIARAFLVSEASMTRRLSRARARLAEVLAESGTLGEATPAVVRERVTVVCGVLYLIFNEGYAATAGEGHQRRELAAEAVRLARLLHRAVPDDDEVTGLLALLLLTDARHAARTAPDGSLVPLADQDRSLWDRERIAEGIDLLLPVLRSGPVGRYQLQAAIAAAHAEAASAEATDWREIVGLYRLLEAVAPNPLHTLSRAVAEVEAYGVAVAAETVASVRDDPRVADSHRLLAVTALLRDRAGDRGGAAGLYREAARRAPSVAEQRHLRSRADDLDGPHGSSS